MRSLARVGASLRRCARCERKGRNARVGSRNGDSLVARILFETHKWVGFASLRGLQLFPSAADPEMICEESACECPEQNGFRNGEAPPEISDGTEHDRR